MPGQFRLLGLINSPSHMPLKKLVPQSLRREIRSIQARLTAARTSETPLSQGQAHDYWRSPDAINSPDSYATADPHRSELLRSLVQRYSRTESKALEIGCNVGRNLEHLRQAGYTALSGIEISPAAVEALQKTYPELAAMATIHLGAVEEILPSLPTDSFDVAYTLAVLEHIHSDSEWVFAHIVRVAPVIVTIEDEHERSHRHFPRNYRKVFEPLGMKQVHAERCDDIRELSSNFVARCFVRGAL